MGVTAKLSAFLCLSATCHFNTSGRDMVECTRSIISQSVRPAAAYLAISLLHPSGEKKQTFSVASLQLTVQLPCLKVFSSFILPSRACPKGSFGRCQYCRARSRRRCQHSTSGPITAKPQIDEDSSVTALAHGQTRDVLWCARHARGLNCAS